MNFRFRVGLFKIKYVIKIYFLVNDFYFYVVYIVNDILLILNIY